MIDLCTEVEVVIMTDVPFHRGQAFVLYLCCAQLWFDFLIVFRSHTSI